MDRWVEEGGDRQIHTIWIFLRDHADPVAITRQICDTPSFDDGDIAELFQFPTHFRVYNNCPHGLRALSRKGCHHYSLILMTICCLALHLRSLPPL